MGRHASGTTKAKTRGTGGKGKFGRARGIGNTLWTDIHRLPPSVKTLLIQKYPELAKDIGTRDT